MIKAIINELKTTRAIIKFLLLLNIITIIAMGALTYYTCNLITPVIQPPAEESLLDDNALEEMELEIINLPPMPSIK